jgi:hypothetical protein
VVMKLLVTGVRETLHALEELPKRVGHKHLRIAMNAGGGILKRSAESHVPTETGLLRKSLGVKVKIPDASFNAKHHGKPAYAVIGPRRNFVRASITGKQGKPQLLTDRKALKRVLGGGKVKTRNPARYAHLVHGGTKSHAVNAVRARVLSNGTQTFGRRVVVSAKPNRFLERAVQSAGSPAKAKVFSKLQEGILSEARQLANV